jgi:hypothetical protein
MHIPRRAVGAKLVVRNVASRPKCHPTHRVVVSLNLAHLASECAHAEAARRLRRWPDNQRHRYRLTKAIPEGPITMDTTNQNAGGAPQQDDSATGGGAAAYWRACAALRAGEHKAAIGGLLTLAWASSPSLRARVRVVLADYGATVSDDPAPAPMHGGAASGTFNLPANFVCGSVSRSRMPGRRPPEGWVRVWVVGWYARRPGCVAEKRAPPRSAAASCVPAGLATAANGGPMARSRTRRPTRSAMALSGHASHGARRRCIRTEIVLAPRSE